MQSNPAWNHCHWRPHASIPRSRVPDSVRAWVFAQGSLTRHLVHASLGDFRVQVLRQEWGRPCRHEARALGIRTSQRCLVREVLLICKGRPWVFARSLLPESSLRGKLRFLRKLDNRPLGALLFREKSMRVGLQELALIPPQALPAPEGLKENAWGRRNVYFLHDCPLLVTEVFLPWIAEAPPPSG